MSTSEAAYQAARWRERARGLRQQSEWLCREAAELLDAANDSDLQADTRRRLVELRDPNWPTSAMRDVGC
jgi:hypothetical protein